MMCPLKFALPISARRVIAMPLSPMRIWVPLGDRFYNPVFSSKKACPWFECINQTIMAMQLRTDAIKVMNPAIGPNVSKA